MDMEIIDTVNASTLEVGDTIHFIEDGEDIGLREISSMDEFTDRDGFDLILIVSTEGDESLFDPFEVVNIYGYIDSED